MGQPLPRMAGPQPTLEPSGMILVSAEVWYAEPSRAWPDHHTGMSLALHVPCSCTCRPYGRHGEVKACTPGLLRHFDDLGKGLSLHTIKPKSPGIFSALELSKLAECIIYAKVAPVQAALQSMAGHVWILHFPASTDGLPATFGDKDPAPSGLVVLSN